MLDWRIAESGLGSGPPSPPIRRVHGMEYSGALAGENAIGAE